VSSWAQARGMMRGTWLLSAILLIALNLVPVAAAKAAGQQSLLIDRITRPPRDNDSFDADDKARAIDLLGQQHAEAAILPLIDCLGDTRALFGSDNWVGGHAANALQAITGQSFGIDAGAWRRWYSARQDAGKGPHER